MVFSNLLVDCSPAFHFLISTSIFNRQYFLGRQNPSELPPALQYVFSTLLFCMISRMILKTLLFLYIIQYHSFLATAFHFPISADNIPSPAHPANLLCICCQYLYFKCRFTGCSHEHILNKICCQLFFLPPLSPIDMD